VACCPEATDAEILERHPDAVAAEPFAPTIRQPSAPMTASEEAAIRAWLEMIEEPAPAVIDDVLNRCRHDAECRDYYLRRAAEHAADERVGRMIAKLEHDAGLRYAIETHTEVEPGAVILSVAIRGKGACELRIPKSRYDVFALLALIQKGGE
jgi:hypothetical protein